jgi:hypothetical protein
MIGGLRVDRYSHSADSYHDNMSGRLCGNEEYEESAKRIRECIADDLPLILPH